MSIKDELEALHGAAKDMVTQIENLAHSVGVSLQQDDGDDDGDVYEGLNGVPDLVYETATDYLFRRFSGVEEIAVPHLRDLKRKAFRISREFGDDSRIEDDKGISYFHKDVLARAFDEVFSV